MTEQVKVGQVWRRKKGVQVGKLVLVQRVGSFLWTMEPAVEWKADSGSGRGSLVLSDWLDRYELVKDVSDD